MDTCWLLQEGRQRIHLYTSAEFPHCVRWSTLILTRWAVKYFCTSSLINYLWIILTEKSSWVTMKQILSFVILQSFKRISSGAVKEMHKEDVRIRPCISAMNWDNPCRLLNLVPPSFLCMIVHRRISAGRKGNSRNIINVQKWLLIYL